MDSSINIERLTTVLNRSCLNSLDRDTIIAIVTNVPVGLQTLIDGQFLGDANDTQNLIQRLQTMAIDVEQYSKQTKTETIAILHRHIVYTYMELQEKQFTETGMGSGMSGMDKYDKYDLFYYPRVFRAYHPWIQSTETPIANILSRMPFEFRETLRYIIKSNLEPKDRTYTKNGDELYTLVIPRIVNNLLTANDKESIRQQLEKNLTGYAIHQLRLLFIPHLSEIEEGGVGHNITNPDTNPPADNGPGPSPSPPTDSRPGPSPSPPTDSRPGPSLPVGDVVPSTYSDMFYAHSGEALFSVIAIIIGHLLLKSYKERQHRLQHTVHSILEEAVSVCRSMTNQCNCTVDCRTTNKRMYEIIKESSHLSDDIKENMKVKMKGMTNELIRFKIISDMLVPTEEEKPKHTQAVDRYNRLSQVFFGEVTDGHVHSFGADNRKRQKT